MTTPREPVARYSYEQDGEEKSFTLKQDNTVDVTRGSDSTVNCEFDKLDADAREGLLTESRKTDVI